MAIQPQILLNGSVLNDARSISVDRSTGEFNTTSSFDATFDNFAGRHSGTFTINDFIKVQAANASDFIELKDLQHHYKFEEGTGSVAIDSVGSLTGSHVGNVTYVQGKIGSAISLPSGTVAQVNLGANGTNPLGWSTTGSFSMSAWVNFTLPDAVNIAVAELADVDNKAFVLGMTPPARKIQALTLDPGFQELRISGTTTLASGVWHHVGVSYKAGSVNLYVNGSLDASGIISPGSFADGLADQTKIGAEELVDNNGFGGFIDDFRYYNVDVGSTTFSNLHDEKKVLFNGIIEDVKYSGNAQNEKVSVAGRDLGAILQDIIVQPRIFKDTEISAIINSLMQQNVSSTLITTNNVNTTQTTLDKITFNNISVFDALKKLADLAGFFFYVDENRDLHFEQRDSVSSQLTFDNSNVLRGNFRKADHEIFNKVTVYGDQQLTNAEEEFITGTDNTGSVYILEEKPFNVQVFESGTTNTLLQPGGVANFNDPAVDNVKYLVDFQAKQIILTSGTAAGDNILTTGSVLIVNYDRNTQIVRVRSDPESRFSFGPKDKVIIDRNVSDPSEATTVAINFLQENKEPRTQGSLDLKGILDVTPGHTATVNLPFHDVSNQTHKILNARYDFTPTTVQNQHFLNVSVNNKIADFSDIMAGQMRKLKELEASQIKGNIVILQAGLGSVGVSGVPVGFTRSIGSAFYFHVPNHNQLNSPSSLLGDARAGSTLITLG